MATQSSGHGTQRLIGSAEINRNGVTCQMPYTSAFVKNDSDMQTVCSLRKLYKPDPIVPDSVLRQCADPAAGGSRLFFRVIRERGGRPCGYWNAMPISKDAFTAFTRQKAGTPFANGISHAQQHATMLTVERIPYEKIKRVSHYMYVAGIVAPQHPNILGYDLFWGRRKTAAIVDFLGFLRLLDRQATIRGICAYVDSGPGDSLAKRFNSRPIGQIDSDHTVYSIGASEKKAALNEIDSYIQNLCERRGTSCIPTWLEADQRDFKQTVSWWQ
jgi:hypothetical protein